MTPGLLRCCRLLHDVSLTAWFGSALLRALDRRSEEPVQWAAIGVNLLSGAPLALHRMRTGEHGAVALGVPPVLVGTAVAVTAYGRAVDRAEATRRLHWLLVALIGVLHVLNVRTRGADGRRGALL